MQVKQIWISRYFSDHYGGIEQHCSCPIHDAIIFDVRKATGRLFSPLLIRHTSHLKQAHSEHGAPPKYKKRKKSFSPPAIAHGVLWTCVVLFGRAVQTAPR